MKFRRRPAPLLLLLLPSIATALSAAAQDNAQSTLSKNTPARDARLDPAPSPIVDLNTKSKYEIGTKDAPVDGRDGKPHAGPFVGTEKDAAKKDTKTTKSGSEKGEKVTGKEEHPEIVTADGGKMPKSNDGVMDDPHRQLPKVGTTGTEGGVSEKDKTRKAQEGQTGEKLEKKPDSPKEAPPLPHSEETKIKSDKTKVKDVDANDDGAGAGIGLEVNTPNCHFEQEAYCDRNPTICQINLTIFLILFQTLRIKTISTSPSPIPSLASILSTNRKATKVSFNHCIPSFSL
jgi:hypothetical protein